MGDRQVATVASFSAVKKLLQKLGSWVVRRLSGRNDASGAYPLVTAPPLAIPCEARPAGPS